MVLGEAGEGAAQQHLARLRYFTAHVKSTADRLEQAKTGLHQYTSPQLDMLEVRTFLQGELGGMIIYSLVWIINLAHTLRRRQNKITVFFSGHAHIFGAVLCVIICIRRSPFVDHSPVHREEYSCTVNELGLLRVAFCHSCLLYRVLPVCRAQASALSIYHTTSCDYKRLSCIFLVYVYGGARII